MDEMKIDYGVTRAVENIIGESDKRSDLISRKLKFGISYLDDSCSGIFPNDVIVISASTGVGKTEAATQIATFNAMEGKSVLFFALEAEALEIERRIKYKIVYDLWHKDNSRQQMKITYADWYEKKINLTKYEGEAERIFIEKYQGLKMRYRETDFTIDDFQKALMSEKDEVDLVIIDHLNYFDYEDANENKAITDIVKKIRDMALISSKPIILLAHMRKKERRSLSIMPDLEDIYGSSNVIKIATKVIILAPYYGDVEVSSIKKPNQFKTLFRVAKNRMNGSATRFIGLTSFDIESNTYDPVYAVKQYKPYMESLEDIDGPGPSWVNG